ncbi:GNAT family N-acetyltransferase [Candidatus Bipolaricaulota bacterium]
MKHHLPEGYTLRSATPDDVPAVFELWNSRSLWARNKAPYGEADVLNRWNRPEFNLETDSLLVFSPVSMLVGYAHILDVKNPPVDVFSGYSVHPEHDEQTWLWKALFEWIEAEARRVIPKAPADARIALIAGARDDDSSEKTRLEESGFEYSRTFHRMTVEFGDPPAVPETPDGIRIRPFIPGNDDEAIAHAYRDAFRDHYGHLEQPFETDLAKWRHWMADEDFDPNLWFLAIDATAGGEVAGYSCCYPADVGDDPLGQIDEIGVRRAWRRQGIGRALLTHSLRTLQDRGCKGANLRVDSDNKNQALALYESAGMHVVSSSHTYVKELRPGVNLVAQ